MALIRFIPMPAPGTRVTSVVPLHSRQFRLPLLSSYHFAVTQVPSRLESGLGFRGVGDVSGQRGSEAILVYFVKDWSEEWTTTLNTTVQTPISIHDVYHR